MIGSDDLVPGRSLRQRPLKYAGQTTSEGFNDVRCRCGARMTAALYGAIAVILAAAVTGYVTWLVASRAKSGKIDTSEAATLWQEGTTMRKELRDEVTSLKTQLTAAITAITDLNREIKASRAETERSREETRKSRAETRRLMAQIEELHGEVKTSNALTMGALADNQETRRILLLPKEERTPVEFEHLASVGERQPESDHPVIPPEELRDSDVQIEEEESK